VMMARAQAFPSAIVIQLSMHMCDQNAFLVY